MTLEALKQRSADAWAGFVRPGRPLLLVGDGTCGRAAGSADVIAAVQDELRKRSLEADVVRVGCLGLCYTEPLVEIRVPGGPSVLYGGVTADRARELVDALAETGKPVAKGALAVMDGGALDGLPAFADLPAMQGQVRIVTRHCGRLDPDSLEHYVANGGFTGLETSLRIGPESTIDEVEVSGLRGRGGAGFPTGKKWRFARQAQGNPKYLVCNADEGDPGAFMNRSLLESDPYAVLEGMVIAGYSIGSEEAYVYCRAEYPLAIERLQTATSRMEEAHLLGKNILGSGYSLHIHIKEGAGAFVCGEETALLASIEGRRGMPRVRPPFPAQSGLFGKPTNINNVETFANVPVILSRGSAAYRKQGTEASPGTRTFALAGKVLRTGLVEVPMGIRLRDIIFGMGGGVSSGRGFKAVQTGGPSGGCLPAECLDLPVDYDALAKAGSIMGSGGMIVIDEDTCIADVARYFLSFTMAESCGKCSPCRLGTWQMKSILDAVCTGKAVPEDLVVLEDLAHTIRAASLCGLGQTAPNPVLTTLRYFRSEYEAHVADRKCPALTCPELLTYTIDTGKCKGCELCRKGCPSKAIAGEKKKPHVIDPAACIRCGACRSVCKFGAVVVG